MLDATEDEATFCRRFNLSQHLLAMTSNISLCSYEPRAMVLAMMRSDVRLLELNGVSRQEHIIFLSVSYYFANNAADVRNPCPSLFRLFHDIPKKGLFSLWDASSFRCCSMASAEVT